MKYIKKMFQALGTINSIELAVTDDTKESLDIHINLLDEIRNQVRKLDDLLSIYKEESEISKLNRLAGIKEMQLSSETYHLLKTAQMLEQETSHCFDISLQPLIRLWGIGKKKDFVPTDEEIKHLLKERSQEYLVLDDKFQTAYLKNPNQQIELGSIAKGYAADLALTILKKHDVTNALLNFGGTIYCIGEAKRIGIQNPFKATGEWLGTLSLENSAAVTSGYYEKYFMKNGHCYHHILDPRTGKPSDNNLAGVTLIGANATTLDALSTAIYVMGIEAGSNLLNSFGIEGIFILKSGEILHTKGLEANFQLVRDKTTEESK